jgi:hypothetical protein
MCPQGSDLPLYGTPLRRHHKAPTLVKELQENKTSYKVKGQFIPIEPH